MKNTKKNDIAKDSQLINDIAKESVPSEATIIPLGKKAITQKQPHKHPLLFTEIFGNPEFELDAKRKIPYVHFKQDFLYFDFRNNI